ncbi:MAG TPA: glycoside hydrolase family 25 protein [Polyangiaceae bacterium]|nr:glycoside hydrolase family 25 protein [Polyangiaceae bacterium]
MLSESEAVTTQCPKETVEGLDVYQGQGTIDWSKLAPRVTSDGGLKDGGSSASEDGYAFAFIKATQGNYNTQRTFAANWLNAKSAGLLRGAYHYFDPRIDGVVQADYFLAEVGEDSGELPALLDIECPTSANEADASSNCEYSGNSGWVDSGTLAKRIFDWLATVTAKTGRKPIVYSYPSWFSAVGLTDLRLAGYPLFIASPAACAAVPAPWTSAAFWQYGTSARVPGIVGACSLDRWTGDLASLKAFAASHRGADAGSADAAGALDGSFLDASRDDAGLEASSIIDGTVSTAGSGSAGAALTEAGSTSSADAALVETGTGGAGVDAASAEVGAAGEAREESALSARTEGGCGCEALGARRPASHAPTIAWLVLVLALLARLRRDRAPRRCSTP